jgi:acetyl-CoA acetyltransferase
VTWFGDVRYGGGAGCGVVGNAALAVALHQCDVAVAWRARKRGSAASRPWAGVASAVGGAQQWTRPFGLLRPVDEIAMLTRRYLHEFGATREHLANVALAVRGHANRNPDATMHEKVMTREAYHAARWMSEPLCLFDNCLETDGAAAVVITRTDRARDTASTPVAIDAFAQSIPAQHQTMTNYFNDDPLVGPSYACAERLWANASATAADVDVAQLYDAFSPLVILSLEGYGFCAGEGAAFTEDGGIEWGRRLPVNTSGGPQRGLHPRLQPDRRGRPPDPRHLDQPGRGGRGEPGHQRRGAPTSGAAGRGTERTGAAGTEPDGPFAGLFRDGPAWRARRRRPW